MIVAINAFKGVGKDTFASIWQKLIWRARVESGLSSIANYSLKDMESFGATISLWERKKFADKLKDIICILLGCTRAQLEDQFYKESVLPEVWWYYNLGNNDIRPRWSFKNNSDNMICESRYLVKTTPRLLLQLMGTECGRNIIHPDVWVNSLMSEYVEKFPQVYNPKALLRLPNWLITDMRFSNEFDAVKEKNGKTVTIIGKHDFTKEELNAMHSSETSLLDHSFDYIIKNTKDLLYLEDQVNEVLVDMKLI